MKSKYALSLVFILLFITANMNAQKELSSFDNILKESFTREGPGATAIVTKKGKVIYKGSVGHANVELEVPMRPENVFRIGSITKQFTSVSILMLMEQEKLSLQDEITKYIEDYPTQGKTITIEHLLTHTSGIKSMTNMTSFFSNARKDMTTTEVVDFFKNEEMEFEPGASYNYNNSGYFLLGIIIEKISGKTYAEFIEQEIFAKLDMDNSHYDSFNKIVKNRAAGYQTDDKGLKNADYLSENLPYAAGSLLSNVEDLYKWNQSVIQHKLISKESLEKAWTPYTLNNGEVTGYGYGWSIDKLQGTRAIEHGGGIFGYLTKGIYLPEEDIFVAVFSNCNCQSSEDAATKMAALAMGKPLSWESIEVDIATLKKYEGVYQVEEGDKRTIILKDGKLVSTRGTNRPYNLIPIGEDEFQFENSLTRLKFALDENEMVNKAVTIRANGEEQEAIKTDEEAVLEEREKLQLSDDILNQYVGVYEIMPGFDVTITNEDNQLMAEPKGQRKAELYALSETKFYPTVVDAEVEFVKTDGKVTHLILKQNGREMEGKKKE